MKVLCCIHKKVYSVALYPVPINIIKARSCQKDGFLFVHISTLQCMVLYVIMKIINQLVGKYGEFE